jgi:hypothetical protein
MAGYGLRFRQQSVTPHHPKARGFKPLRMFYERHRESSARFQEACVGKSPTGRPHATSFRKCGGREAKLLIENMEGIL